MRKLTIIAATLISVLGIFIPPASATSYRIAPFNSYNINFESCNASGSKVTLSNTSSKVGQYRVTISFRRNGALIGRDRKYTPPMAPGSSWNHRFSIGHKKHVRCFYSVRWTSFSGPSHE